MATMHTSVKGFSYLVELVGVGKRKGAGLDPLDFVFGI